MAGGSATTAAELLAWVYSEAKRFSDPDARELEVGPPWSRIDGGTPLPPSVTGSAAETASASGAGRPGARA